MAVRDGALCYPLLRAAQKRGLHSTAVRCAAAVNTDTAVKQKFEGKIVLRGPRFGPKDDERPDDMVYESVHNVRTYDFNRSQQGNALTPGMVRSMRKHLKYNNEDVDAAKLIILRTRPPAAEFVTRRRNMERADFCVGDDRHVNLNMRYIREQYHLLDDLYCSRPVVACVEGRADDIGAAIALNCPFRIATTTTAITPYGRGTLAGMHGGAVHMLSKLDFFMGRYLALTGATVRAADAFHTGLCTVYMPRERLSLLHDRLMYLRKFEPDVIAAAINEFAVDPGTQTPYQDDRVLSVLATCFNHAAVEDIIFALQRASADGSKFAQQALQAMQARSPLGLKVTLQMLIDGSELDAQACLQLGFRVAYNADRDKDRLRDLDSLEAVTDEIVAGLFKDVRTNDLDVTTALPFEERPVVQVRTVDDVVRDRLLDWYDPPEDKKASAAVEVHDLHSLLKTMGKTEIEQIAEEQYHTALPPFGPLTLNEVIDVLARCKVHSFEEVAKQLVIRLAVPGNADRLRLLYDMVEANHAGGRGGDGEYVEDAVEANPFLESDPEHDDMDPSGVARGEKEALETLRKDAAGAKPLVGLDKKK